MSSAPLSRALLLARAREIQLYLRFLRAAVHTDATLVARDGAVLHRLPRALTHSLKASAYLLLYSAMEALLMQLLAEIRSAIQRRAPSVDDLHPELFLEVMRSFKSRTADVTADTVTAPIHQSVVQSWLLDYEARGTKRAKRAAELSGSVDGLSIHLTLHRYGVVGGRKDQPLPHLTHKALESTKALRNQLAHGEDSFESLGQPRSVEAISQDALQVLRVLTRVLREVEAYLAGHRFLRVGGSGG